MTDDEISDIVAAFRRNGTVPDDSQAMALVKRFMLSLCGPSPYDMEWRAFNVWIKGLSPSGGHIDLNRAIVEAAAKIQSARQSAVSAQKPPSGDGML